MRTLTLTAGAALWVLAECSRVAAQTPAPQDERASNRQLESLRRYLAAPLDQEGKLAEAIPLYRARAEQTHTTADRLRYASALLRAGRAGDAQPIYDQLMTESGSIEHGGDRVATNAGVIASNLLLSGFPALAVPYARLAHQTHPREASYSLLLIRALCASGDAAGARAVIAATTGAASSWPAGPRVELARWQLSTGDAESARKLLGADIRESLAQMYREAILASAALRAGDWSEASQALDNGIRKAPASLADTKHVDRAWRNAQRELRGLYLRRAISLWKEGKPDLAVVDAGKAQMSDEEYVRSGAIVLQVAADLAQHQRTAVHAALTALAGHDSRFTAAVAQFESALAADRDIGPAIAAFELALANEDRSLDRETTLIFQILTEAARSTSEPQQRSAASR
ncbi:MAG TPA: hypothetical protein VL403_00145 [Candidatus Kryptonia bacterium]|nr:hypothetical protein [Candidatus Kryptonia bacterium]